MNRQQRLDLLQDAEAELEEARAKLGVLNRRVSQLTQLVGGLSGLLEDEDETSFLAAPPPATQMTQSPTPQLRSTEEVARRRDVRMLKPRDAVMEVLSVRPNTPLQPREIVELVHMAGLFNRQLKSGSNGYTTALNRLADDPTTGVVRDEQGQYTYRPERRPAGLGLSGSGTLFAGGRSSE